MTSEILSYAIGDLSLVWEQLDINNDNRWSVELDICFDDGSKPMVSSGSVFSLADDEYALPANWLVSWTTCCLNKGQGTS